MADKTVEYKIAVKTDGAGAALDSLGSKLQGVVGQQGDVAGAAEQSSVRQVAATHSVTDGVTTISKQLDSLKSQMLGLVGVGVGTQGIKDLAALADGYKNLEARIKLTTGEGAAFDTAFDGVFEVAKRTNSAVEETGVLFTKLAEAGKALGLSQKGALSLTETINQSIQLSGASAEASKASITQLVQGLQSGVLRGDEFNSVMEQSPRLAKALADGLGVSTGELRKLAEAGQLTSETVITSLQKQSDAIGAEFGKLPQTVGRAMTNLSTAFTAYVGEADKAGGYTTKLAGVIDALSGNLSTVATVMIHTGQVLGAMKLLSMAQGWIAASVAIKATAVATETATASTIKSTAAKVQNTTATVANTAAQVTNAAAWNDVAAKLGGVGPRLAGAGNAAAKAAGMFGAVGTAVGGLMRAFLPLLALDVALHFKEYGTAIGEWAARMMGAKDRSEELAAADKRAAEAGAAVAAAREKQAAATKAAENASYGLSKSGAKLVADFEEMRKKGDSASDAIEKIGKIFDLADVPGIQTAGAVLDKLLAKGEITAKDFEKAWADALKGEDLAVFEFKARAAFAGAGRSADQLQQALDAGVRESIRRTGLDMDLISGGMGKASAKAINDTDTLIGGLDRLKAMGVDTGQVLATSIGKGIDTAQSEKALAAVRLQIEQVRKVLGDKVADGLLDQAKQKSLELKDALDKTRPGINGVREAMKALGVTSDESLRNTAKVSKEAYDLMVQSGTRSARELGDGFKKAAQDAIAANNGIAPSWVTAAAAARGYTLEIDAAGKATLKAGTEGAKAMGENKDALLAAAAAAKLLKDAYEKLTLQQTLSSNLTDRQIEQLEKENALVERRAALENKRRGVDAAGFSADAQGNRIVAGGPLKTAAGIFNFLKEAGVDNEGIAKSITKEFLDADGSVTYANNRGMEKYGGDTISMSVLHAAEQYTIFGGKEKAKADEKERSDYQAKLDLLKGGAIPAATQGATTTVNINLNGSTRAVKTDADGARVLQDVLSQLASAKGTSSAR